MGRGKLRQWECMLDGGIESCTLISLSLVSSCWDVSCFALPCTFHHVGHLPHHRSKQGDHTQNPYSHEPKTMFNFFKLVALDILAQPQTAEEEGPLLPCLLVEAVPLSGRQKAAL